MHNFYDVQQLLKQFGIFIHVGERLWDLELSAIEIDHLFQARVIDRQDFIDAKRVLTLEHEKEEARLKKQDKIFWG